MNVIGCQTRYKYVPVNVVGLRHVCLLSVEAFPRALPSSAESGTSSFCHMPITTLRPSQRLEYFEIIPHLPNQTDSSGTTGEPWVSTASTVGKTFLSFVLHLRTVRPRVFVAHHTSYASWSWSWIRRLGMDLDGAQSGLLLTYQCIYYLTWRRVERQLLIHFQRAATASTHDARPLCFTVTLQHSIQPSILRRSTLQNSTSSHSLLEPLSLQSTLWPSMGP